MKNKMLESWIWIVAIFDFGLAMGLAQIVVQYAGWKYSIGMSVPLDTSNSILAYTVLFGVTLPIIALCGIVILASYKKEDICKDIN